ncbi:glycosyltransferase [Georgenia sp. H159]|uniref:glycosyltransferase n=1 Tax=Georgenia sp. H159 TaxID=3076115 RepID=UPI002D773989|nr:glycosyltransferase [Georgenia sp. H159]
MRVGIIAPGYPPAYLGGGPIRTVYALSRAASKRHEVLVLTSNRDLGQPTTLAVPHDEWATDESVDVYYATVGRGRAYWSALQALRRRKPDVVYLNSYFSLTFSLVPRLLHRLKWWGAVPLIVAPRGELSPGALQFKARKKRIFLAVARLMKFDAATVWHASSELEASEIRQAIPSAGLVLVRPNETDLPREAGDPEPSVHPTPRFTFVSRIVPKKGLDVALRALAAVVEPLDFDVYGSEEDPEYVAMCSALARQLPEHIRVRFLGPIRPEAVRPTLGAYDAFVLPTHGENFGHVIAEALSTSCPVLTSAATPWTDVLDAGGGVVVAPSTTQAWTRALDAYARRVRADSGALRTAAGAAYEAWRAAQDGPTVFDLYRDHTTQRRNARR